MASPVPSGFGRDSVMTITIDGLIELQELLRELEKTVEPDGMRETMREAVLLLHRGSRQRVHVITSRLRNSIFWEVEQSSSSLFGIVATNVTYSIYEHGRGGDHAFFALTIRDDADQVFSLFDDTIEIALEAYG